jgi:hypothetical protein
VGVLLLIVGGALNVFGMHEIAMVIYATAVPWVVVGLGAKLDVVAKGLHAVAGTLESAATQLDTAQPAPSQQTVIVTTGVVSPEAIPASTPTNTPLQGV